MRLIVEGQRGGWQRMSLGLMESDTLDFSPTGKRRTMLTPSMSYSLFLGLFR